VALLEIRGGGLMRPLRVVKWAEKNNFYFLVLTEVEIKGTLINGCDILNPWFIKYKREEMSAYPIYTYIE
jgi:hypothetical protein